MSIITNVFHIYGFLITEDAATAIRSYAKEKWEKNNPKSFQAFSAAEDITLFQEYLVDTYGDSIMETLNICPYGASRITKSWT